MRVFLAIDDSNIEDEIKTSGKFSIVDSESNLYVVKGLIGKKDEEYLILSALNIEIEILQDIARRAKKKDIKVVTIINDNNDNRTKKIIAALSAEEVYGFININDFNLESIETLIKNYPSEFDYKLLSSNTEDKELEIKIIEKPIEPVIKTKVVEVVRKEVVEKVKILRNQIITCFSTDDGFDSAEVASMLAYEIKRNNDITVLLIDFNNLYANIDYFFNIDKNVSLGKNLSDTTKVPSLRAMVDAINGNVGLKESIFKNLIIKDKKLKFDVLTGLYDLIKDDKVTKEHYEKIIDMASRLYDVVVINTNPYFKSAATFTSITNATKVVGVTKGNLAAIRNMLATFSVLVNKNDISIIVSGLNDRSLSKENLYKAITDKNGYRIIGLLKYDSNRELSLNEGSAYYKVGDKENLQEYENIIKQLGFTSSNKDKKRRRLLWKIGGR